MRRLYETLPGPPLVRVLIIVGAVVALLIALFFLFEWAGDWLDTGGVVGPSP